jgi:hypothetical protein
MCRSKRFSVLRVALLASAVVVFPSLAHAAASEHSASELIGTWRGTSVCTDRVAAPACKDESVVYEFAAGAKRNSVHWKADKIVDGKRVPMGEFDLVYRPSDSCWTAEVTSPRFHMVWSLTVNGAALHGTATLLPGREVVRRIEARKE